jgi:hypothetical protein
MAFIAAWLNGALPRLVCKMTPVALMTGVREADVQVVRMLPIWASRSVVVGIFPLFG